MNELITISNNEAVTTTLAIAEGTEVQHKNVYELVKNYVNDLSEFGIVTFETEKLSGVGRPTEYAILNEDQATLLMTYMRNSEVVRNFKKRLVKEFRNAVNQLSNRLPQTYTQALRALLESEEAKEQLAIENAKQVKQLEEAKPKVEYFDALIDNKYLIPIADVAKMLRIRDHEFREWLRWNFILLSENGGRSLPSAEMMNKGYMEVKRVPYFVNEVDVSTPTPYFTDSGVQYIMQRVTAYKNKYPDMYTKSFPKTLKTKGVK